MKDPGAMAFLNLVRGRHGHFKLESGHHSELWLDLDPLFADPKEVAPMVSELSKKIRSYEVDFICGPLLGGAFLALLAAKEIGAQFCFTERTMPPGESGLFAASYLLPSAYRERVRGRRIAIVDDVMSAGSALRGTYSELQSHGGNPVVVCAMLTLGSRGTDFFEGQKVSVETLGNEPFETWSPESCPQCQAGVPLESVATPA